jgi:hypothetical protein
MRYRGKLGDVLQQRPLIDYAWFCQPLHERREARYARPAPTGGMSLKKVGVLICRRQHRADDWEPHCAG